MFSGGGRSGDRHLYCLDAVICAGSGLTLYSLNKQGLSLKKKDNGVHSLACAEMSLPC